MTNRLSMLCLLLAFVTGAVTEETCSPSASCPSNVAEENENLHLLQIGLSVQNSNKESTDSKTPGDDSEEWTDSDDSEEGTDSDDSEEETDSDDSEEEIDSKETGKENDEQAKTGSKASACGAASDCLSASWEYDPKEGLTSLTLNKPFASGAPTFAVWADNDNNLTPDWKSIGQAGGSSVVTLSNGGKTVTINKNWRSQFAIRYGKAIWIKVYNANNARRNPMIFQENDCEQCAIKPVVETKGKAKGFTRFVKP